MENEDKKPNDGKKKNAVTRFFEKKAAKKKWGNGQTKGKLL